MLRNFNVNILFVLLYFAFLHCIYLFIYLNFINLSSNRTLSDANNEPSTSNFELQLKEIQNTVQSTSNASDTEEILIYDIGVLVSEKKRETLTQHDKYLIVKNRPAPGKNFEFPKTLKHGCMRSCKKEHLSDCFVYSDREDSVYCLYCALFSPKCKGNDLKSFVNHGYREWHNILEKEKKHMNNVYHQEAVLVANGIIDRFENPKNTLPAETNDIIMARYQVYSRIVHALARVVHLLGKLSLSFRGHREEIDVIDIEKNPGNFIAVLRELSHYYPDLDKHLREPLRKDVTYLSPKSQNELINVIGKKVIQAKLIEEIKTAGMHSISADEVTSSNDEILSICMRYVNTNKDISEVFLEYVSLERITGEHIGKAILNFYSESGLRVTECRGQCYDGAANMQSQKKGTASYVLQESPKAIVTHCCSHNLNLSLASSCKMPIVNNILETYKSVMLHFNMSPKRESLLSFCRNATTSSIFFSL